MKLNQQEREQHPIRAEQEEDTESKLMELHKQVQKLSCKNYHHAVCFFLGGTTGVDVEETETSGGSHSKSTGDHRNQYGGIIPYASIQVERLMRDKEELSDKLRLKEEQLNTFKSSLAQVLGYLA